MHLYAAFENVLVQELLQCIILAEYIISFLPFYQYSTKHLLIAFRWETAMIKHTEIVQN